MFGAGKNFHSTHFPAHIIRKAHAFCNLYCGGIRNRLQCGDDYSSDFPMSAFRSGLGCDHHLWVVHQSTGRLCHYSCQQHCHRSRHFDHSHSDGGKVKNTATAEDWTRVHVCRRILVSFSVPKREIDPFENLTGFLFRTFITSIVRLITLQPLFTNPDQTWVIVTPATWV